MKYLLISGLFLLLNSFSFSKNSSHIFVKENKMWVFLKYSSPEYEICCPDLVYKKTMFYKIGKDSLVDTLTYKSVSMSVDNKKTWNFHGLIREDSLSNVFYIFKDSVKELLVYRYDLKEGDNVYDNCQVIKIDTIQIGGGDRLKYTIKKPNVPATDQWVEGIGSLGNSFMRPLTTCFAGPGAKEYETLLCVFEDESLLYHNERYDECYYSTSCVNYQFDNNNVYPNPATEKIEFIFDVYKERNIQVFDIEGKKLIDTIFVNIIDIHFLPQGNYVYVIQEDNLRQITGSFIKGGTK